MKKITRTRLTINTSELILIKKLHLAQADCPDCGVGVEMVTPEQAVTLTRITSRAIFLMVENGALHFIETNDGHLLICLNSLKELPNRGYLTTPLLRSALTGK